MNIYKVSRRDRIQYDQYDSFVCYAKDETAAAKMTPYPITYPGDAEEYLYQVNREWTSDPANISVEYVGMCLDAEEEKIILASYNAG